jgi:GTP-binding protein LepA
MNILVNNEPVDALSMIVHRSRPNSAAALCERLKDLIPPPVQDPDPGGDRRQGDRARNHRRDAQGRDRQVLWRRHHAQKKLLEKQKEGKKRMREYGNQIPQEAFIAALRMGEE